MVAVPVPTIDNLIRLGPTWSLAKPNRRHHHRFPIIAQAEYILGGHRANATTVDIGSGGLLLKTRNTLGIGQRIVVLIDWPALLDERLPLRLVVFGKVLRSNGAGTAVGITRYEYRISAQSVARSSA